MAGETFLSNWIISDFILPFVLVFAIVFAILERTNILGKDKHQVNSIVSFAIGLIFVSAVFPKQVVGNLILFLTVAVIIVFVALLIWGFATGSESPKMEGWVMKLGGVVLTVAMIIAIMWAAGLQWKFFNDLFDFLFNSSWSTTFWTNISFIVVIAIAIVAVLISSKGGSK